MVEKRVRRHGKFVWRFGGDVVGNIDVVGGRKVVHVTSTGLEGWKLMLEVQQQHTQHQAVVSRS